MAFKFTEGRIGLQVITETSTTQQHELGLICKADDPTLGSGEFIYLKGVASTVVGSIVDYDVSFQTALHTTALNTPSAVAVAMSANVADQYGWYQISGLTTMNKSSAVSFAAGAAMAGGSGLAIAAVSGLIMNAALVAAVASAKSTTLSVKVMVNRPHGPSDVS